MRRTMLGVCALALVATACTQVAESIARTTTSAPPNAVATTPAPQGDDADPTTTTTIAATTTLPDEAAYLFSLIETEAFGIGAEAWDGGFVGPGAIGAHAGEYHMIYPGFSNRNATATPGIGYAASRNGLDFFRQGEEPVLDPYTVDYIDPTIGTLRPGNVVVEDDGTWVLYFSTSGHEGRRASGVISRATAPAPAGPWTIHPEPLLTNGESGEWDALAAVNPHVIKTDDGYLMWYDGDAGDLDARPNRHIGLATSDDGVTWTKYDDPATTEPPFHVSDPVFMLSDEEDAWDSFRVYEPSVIPVDNGYVMFYGSDRRYEGQLERTWEFGYATSTDGIVWERSNASPIWSTIGDVFTGVFASTAVRDPDGTWRLYIGAGSGISLPTAVRVLEFSGELP